MEVCKVHKCSKSANIAIDVVRYGRNADRRIILVELERVATKYCVISIEVCGSSNLLRKVGYLNIRESTLVGMNFNKSEFQHSLLEVV